MSNAGLILARGAAAVARVAWTGRLGFGADGSRVRRVGVSQLGAGGRPSDVMASAQISGWRLRPGAWAS